jgi:hypothetical protein
MSAFIVSEEHIQSIVRGISQQDHFSYYHKGRISVNTDLELNRIGQLLVNQNFKSVNVRYNSNQKPEQFMIKHFGKKRSAIQLIKACDCLEYQSCETDDYYQSEAYRIIDTARRRFIRTIPEYEDADWEIEK